MHDSITLTPAPLPSVMPKAPSNVGGQVSPELSQPAVTPNTATKSHIDARTYQFTLFPPSQSSYPRQMASSPMNFGKSVNPSLDALSFATST